MSAWERNFAVVRERWPEVAKRLERVRKPAAPAWRPEDAAQRVATLWLHGRRVRDGALLAVTGWGDGVHVRQLLAALPKRAWVFVGAADPAELRAALSRTDDSAWLADPRLSLGVGECDEEFFRALARLPVLQVSDVQPMIFAPEYNRAPSWHARYLAEFARHVDVRRKLEGTRVADAALWQANTFANLPQLVDAPDLAVLRGACAGLPMVIVSAGPSLDESLEFLRAASRVAVIVAVNSSYRAVRRAGIVPPLVLAADPREFTARGFADTPVDGTYLATTHIVNPEVVAQFCGRVFTWSGSNETVQTLRRRSGLGAGTVLVEQGTVSACAVDLAILLGCPRICLVGQDLAVQADGRSHAQDSFYSDLGTNHAELAECRRLPGNTLPEVLVEGKLYVYLKVFEQLVVHRPGLKWLNTARRGARIAGVPYASFDEALRWLGKGNAAKVPAVLAGRHVAGTAQCLDADRLRATLGGTREFAVEVLRSALAAIARIEAVPEPLLATGHEAHPDVVAGLSALTAMQDLLAKFPDETVILEEGRTRFELYKAQAAEAQVARLQEHARQLLLGRELAWAVAEGAWFLARWLERIDADLTTPVGVNE